MEARYWNSVQKSVRERNEDGNFIDILDKYRLSKKLFLQKNTKKYDATKIISAIRTNSTISRTLSLPKFERKT